MGMRSQSGAVDEHNDHRRYRRQAGPIPPNKRRRVYRAVADVLEG